MKSRVIEERPGSRSFNLNVWRVKKSANATGGQKWGEGGKKEKSHLSIEAVSVVITKWAARAKTKHSSATFERGNKQWLRKHTPRSARSRKSAAAPPAAHSCPVFGAVAAAPMTDPLPANYKLFSAANAVSVFFFFLFFLLHFSHTLELGGGTAAARSRFTQNSQGGPDVRTDDEHTGRRLSQPGRTSQRFFFLLLLF